MGFRTTFLSFDKVMQCLYYSTVCFGCCSYLRAVAMARHKDFLVEKKRVNKYNLSVKCGSIKDVSAAFAQMMEITMPSKRHVHVVIRLAHTSLELIEILFVD